MRIPSLGTPDELTLFIAGLDGTISSRRYSTVTISAIKSMGYNRKGARSNRKFFIFSGIREIFGHPVASQDLPGDNLPGTLSRYRNEERVAH
jgi:hypothetical protein